MVQGFKLRLQIADMGGMGLTSEGVALIHVSDINNHAPQFSPTSVSVRLLIQKEGCFDYDNHLVAPL